MSKMSPKAKALYDKHDKEWFAERVVELEEIRQTLHDNIDRLKNDYQAIHLNLENDKVILQRQVVTLKKYAKHSLACDYYFAHDIGPESICECGLKEALKGED
jgi:uncharacterized protein (DUF2461 family)